MSTSHLPVQALLSDRQKPSRSERPVKYLIDARPQSQADKELGKLPLKFRLFHIARGVCKPHIILVDGVRGKV